MRVLLVAPPRVLWPYINEQDNYLVPQNLACLAAVLRQDGVEVTLVDCMPLRLGWKSLERVIREVRPQVVAGGENHACFASEVVRLMHLAKAVDPAIVTVVGGNHFTNAGEEYLANDPIDFIVRGEGEITFRELVRALDGGDALAPFAVEGLCYRREGQIVYTPPRALIEDLDSLPLPAYDLLPMEKYGNARYLFSPGGATLHHSRGCVGSCRFCSWWTQMAERRVEMEGGCRRERVLPRWRTRSVGSTLEEMEVLHERYGKNCLVFVDPTFNIDARWDDAFATELLRKKWRLNWFAFLRGDFLLRDERLGILEKMVASGLSHTCIGVERLDEGELDEWGKSFATREHYREIFGLLSRKYPQVFRQASFIVGTRRETPESMRAHFEFARELDVDFPSFHPVTPFPGTPLYEEARANGWLEVTDFDRYDLMTPIMPGETMTRDAIEAGLAALNREYIGARWLLRGLLSRSRYRRDMYTWWLTVTARVFADTLSRRLNPFSHRPYMSSVTPPWYED